MATPEPEPQLEVNHSRITLLRELAEGQEPIYHFFVDGKDTYLTMTRDKVDETPYDFTYHLNYGDWAYGEMDVHCGLDAVVIDWQGISADQQDKLAEIEAERFMAGSTDFMLTAIIADFPGMPVQDFIGNRLY
jgi:hypothetical protein